MIEEINSTSQTLSKTGKPDDPVRFPSQPPPIQALTHTANKGRPRPQHPALPAPAHRLRRLAATGQDQQGAKRDPRCRRQRLERPRHRPGG